MAAAWLSEATSPARACRQPTRVTTHVMTLSAFSGQARTLRPEGLEPQAARCPRIGANEAATKPEHSCGEAPGAPKPPVPKPPVPEAALPWEPGPVAGSQSSSVASASAADPAVTATPPLCVPPPQGRRGLLLVIGLSLAWGAGTSRGAPNATGHTPLPLPPGAPGRRPARSPPLGAGLPQTPGALSKCREVAGSQEALGDMGKVARSAGVCDA